MAVGLQIELPVAVGSIPNRMASYSDIGRTVVGAGKHVVGVVVVAVAGETAVVSASGSYVTVKSS